MTRWEYKSVSLKCPGFFKSKLDNEDLEQLLNSLGKLGWELVHVVPLLGNGYTQSITAILKRPANTDVQTRQPVLPPRVFPNVFTDSTTHP